ncbi:hypothetical protein HOC13_03180 [Candidatus Woesearchaeota archaeon]|jgi:hypothetical protein|nr:hypothetical protein [Candidatus Woesearchaeota archaeon]
MKKGQLTIFIILGIILLLGAGLLLTFKEVLIKDNRGQVQEIVVKEIIKDPLQDYVEECIKQTGEKGIKLLASNGGYLAVEGSGDYDEAGNGEEFYGFYYGDEVKLPYVLDGEEIGLRSKEEMENVLGNYILVELKDCIDGFKKFEEEGKEVNYAELGLGGKKVEVFTTIQPHQVEFEVKWPVVVGQKGQVKEFDVFKSEVNTELGKLYEIAEELLKDIKEEQPFDFNQGVKEYLTDEEMKGVYLESNSKTKEYSLTLVDGAPTQIGKMPLKMQFALKNVEMVSNVVEGFSGSGFKDEDLDGVPNYVDSCWGSISKVVDELGCNCEQKDCFEVCVVEDAEPKCESVEEVIEEVKEEKVDCKFVGCMPGLDCQEDGSCSSLISLEGKKCKTQDVFYSLSKINCAAKGEGWIEEEKDKFIDVNVDSWLFFVEDYAQEEADKMFEEVTICVKVEDMGCASPKIKCFGENQLTLENKDKAAEILRKEIKKNMDLPWYVDWFIDVNVGVDLSGFEIGFNYGCEDIVLKEEDACKILIENGEIEEKADIVFIADGYTNEEEIKKIVLEVIDYGGENKGTVNEGLFSEEPFKSHKKKFNIWYLDSKGEISYGKDPYNPAWGNMPKFKDVVKVSNQCPWFDYLVVLSKDQSYRANCMMGMPGPCRISLKGEKYTGRLVTHELGHGIGGLADEYYNYIEKKDDPHGFEEFYHEFQLGENCQKDMGSATEKWGNLVEGKIGYYLGCGGDCGTGCAEYVRPTFNSVMKAQNKKCDIAEECGNGPPYDNFYLVNTKKIMKELEQFS